uniref:Odorant binding protein n=1 Tax=Meteorus pulchricornis TaxID=51522 RepID=A0A1S5VFG1_9HYME
MKNIGSASSCLVLFFVICVNANGIVEHKALREKCRDESKLTDDDIKMSTMIADHLGCYLFCFLKDLEVMDDKGSFDPAAATDAVEEELREASRPEIYSCYESYSSDDDALNDNACSTALEMTRCFKEHAQNLYEVMGIFEPVV